MWTKRESDDLVERERTKEGRVNYREKRSINEKKEQ